MRARLIRYLREEHIAHPWMLPGVALTGAAALGMRFQELLDLLRSLL